jgi:hypothetical protein
MYLSKQSCFVFIALIFSPLTVFAADKKPINLGIDYKLQANTRPHGLKLLDSSKRDILYNKFEAPMGYTSGSLYSINAKPAGRSEITLDQRCHFKDKSVMLCLIAVTGSSKSKQKKLKEYIPAIGPTDKKTVESRKPVSRTIGAFTWNGELLQFKEGVKPKLEEFILIHSLVEKEIGQLFEMTVNGVSSGIQGMKEDLVSIFLPSFGAEKVRQRKEAKEEQAKLDSALQFQKEAAESNSKKLSRNSYAVEFISIGSDHQVWTLFMTSPSRSIYDENHSNMDQALETVSNQIEALSL